MAHKPRAKPRAAVAYATSRHAAAPAAGRAGAADPVEAPKPVVKPGTLGTVESVREVEVKGESQGLGAVAGGIAGAVLGHQIGKGHGTHKVVTVLGAAGGALARQRRSRSRCARTKHWEIDRAAATTARTQTVQAATRRRSGSRATASGCIDGKLQPA